MSPKRGDERERFLKKAKATFISVRDPFERLVSAYMVKNDSKKKKS